MAEKKAKKFNTKDIVYIGLFASLIVICSWISIPLTVPVTLQTLAVCLTAGLSGAKKGVLSVAIYIFLGIVGLPVFSGFKSGIGALLSPTGGYVIGFIFTALIVGIVSDRSKGKIIPLVLSMITGVIACYFFGTIWFAVIYANQNSSPAALTTILGWCVVPFIIPDGVKIAIASLLTIRLKRFIK